MAESATFSPDGAWVLYLADALVDEQVELLRAAVDGSSAAVLLSGPMVAGGDVSWHTQSRLYVTHAGGQPARSLTPRLPADRWLTKFTLLPDGNRVLHLADEDVPERMELYESLLVPPHRAR